MYTTTQTYDLPLLDPFTIARGTTTSQPTLVVKLHAGELVGLGEATSNDFYQAQLGSMQNSLERIAPKLTELQPADPKHLWNLLDEDLRDDRFTQAALDIATNDLWGKFHDQPLWKIWELDPSKSPPSCYTLGIDTPEVMLRKMNRMPGWPIYKVKLGRGNDLDVIRFLRKHTDAKFRVDANCGWTAEQVLPMAEQLATLGVELIEQPLPIEQWSAMEKIRDKSPLPLMADESCQTLEDVERCAAGFHAINIKLVKCGGLTPARRMIDVARQLGLKVMVGCMTESSIGISAGAQLLPLLDFADLDGALLLAKDIAKGVTWDRGKCNLNVTPGIGAELIQ